MLSIERIVGLTPNEPAPEVLVTAIPTSKLAVLVNPVITPFEASVPDKVCWPVPVKYASAALIVFSLPPKRRSAVIASTIYPISLRHLLDSLTVPQGPSSIGGRVRILEVVKAVVRIKYNVLIELCTLAQEAAFILLPVIGSAVIVRSLTDNWFVIANIDKSFALLKANTDWVTSPTTPSTIGSPFTSKYALVAAIVLALPPSYKSAAIASTINPISRLHLSALGGTNVGKATNIWL